MEAELSCSLCCQLLTEPLLLPCCCRAICAACANTPPQDSNNEDVASDKASVYSETDSGVVVAPTKGSQVGPAHPVPPPVIPPPASYAEESDTLLCPVAGCSAGVEPSPGTTTPCPACQKPLVLGAAGLSGLPPYPAMARIVSRHKGELGSSGAPFPPCQLCEGPPGDATVSCEQCQVQYCGPCLSSCHPARGPLSTHTLTQVAPLATFQATSVAVCTPHGEVGDVYCIVCGCVVCVLCQKEKHSQHDLQPLDQLSKTHKVSFYCIQNRSIYMYIYIHTMLSNYVELFLLILMCLKRCCDTKK